MRNETGAGSARRKSEWRRLFRETSWWVVSGLALSTCACSAVNRPMAGTSTDPFLSDEPARTETSVAAEKTSAKVLLQPARPIGTPPALPSTVQPAGYASRETNRSAIRTVQHEVADPRMSLDCPVCPVDCPTGVIEERFPDEYLCDGGDRDLPVHFSGPQLVGLETEDTVIEFEDEEGRRRVKPANKLCIYAPRFAAVLSVSAPLVDVGGGRPLQAVATAGGVGLKSRDVSFVHEQRDMTERMVSRVRGSGLQTGVLAEALDRPEAIHGHVHTTTPFTNYGFLRTGRVHNSEEAALVRRVQSAVTWTRDQNPVILAVTDGANELRGRFQPVEFVGHENRNEGKSKLRIVKLANKEIAAPGDVITFEIRYDNVGDQEVNRVVIVDNLTPRLEYIEGSSTSDRRGEMIPDENGEGSLILRWELSDPLPAHEGGLVTFQARVR